MLYKLYESFCTGGSSVLRFRPPKKKFPPEQIRKIFRIPFPSKIGYMIEGSWSERNNEPENEAMAADELSGQVRKEAFASAQSRILFSSADDKTLVEAIFKATLRNFSPSNNSLKMILMLQRLVTG